MRLTLLTRCVLLAALPSSALLFACGGGSDKKVDANDWVADLCDIAADFEDASDEAGADFEDADFDDTEEAKKAFADSLKAQKDAQKDFRSAFDKLGQPDIEDGDKVVEAFKEQFEENDELANDIGKAVADIDDDDDFLEAFLDIAADFDEPDFREKLSELAEDSDDVQDLIDEIDDDEDCSATIFDSEAADETRDPTPTASRTAVAVPTVRPVTPAAANTTNERWVSGICTSFSGWVLDLEKANQTFQTKLDSSTGDGAAVKKLLVDFLKIGQTETKNLQREIGALRAPDVADGAKIHKVFVDTSGDLVAVFDRLVSDAEKISTASAAQTRADVDRLSEGIGDAFDEAGAGFNSLDNLDAPELEKLFDTRPECEGF